MKVANDWLRIEIWAYYANIATVSLIIFWNRSRKQRIDPAEHKANVDFIMSCLNIVKNEDVENVVIVDDFDQKDFDVVNNEVYTALSQYSAVQESEVVS